jgi:hypothetical protein
MLKKTTALALAIAFAAALSAGALAAPPSGKGEAGKSAAAESGKKPGQTCDKLDHGSQAYKDCIAKAAHGDKTPKGAEHGKGKGKGTP